jgi:cytochrome P450 family 135
VTTLPPGPDASPLVQTIAYHRDPLGVLRRARARFGPVFTLRFVWKDPLVFVTDPAAVPGLLDSDPHAAHAGEARRGILPQASPRSPFGADAAQHHATRGRMEPAFSPGAMTRAEPRLRELTAEHVARWPVGRPFRLLPRMRTLAIDSFLRVVLGAREPVPLIVAIRRMLWTPGNPPLPVPGDGDGVAGRVGDAVFARRAAPVAGLLRAELDRRRRDDFAGEDLLGRMVASGLDDAAIVDELLVVLMAAQEPPSIAMTNVVLELARQPGDTEPDAGAVAEALRLRPAAQAALRRLTAPVAVAGHELPAGTAVALPSPLLHRDPTAFPEPDAFRADRFTDDEPPAAYLPFGGGARRCIGEPLARAQFRAVLPEVVSRLRFRAAWPRPERMVARGTVLVPHRGGLVVATAR